MSQTFYATVKHWVDVQVTTAGVATFYPTDDGTATGTPLFTAIYAAQFTPEANVSTFTSVPRAALKLVSADRKTITCNVSTGTVLGILGATELAAPDGTKVHALVMGN